MALSAMAAMFIMFHSCVKLPESIRAVPCPPAEGEAFDGCVPGALQVVAISAAGNGDFTMDGFHQPIWRSSPMEK